MCDFPEWDNRRLEKRNLFLKKHLSFCFWIIIIEEEGKFIKEGEGGGGLGTGNWEL